MKEEEFRMSDGSTTLRQVQGKPFDFAQGKAHHKLRIEER